MERKFGLGKAIKEPIACKTCGCKCAHKDKEVKPKRTSERGQKIKELMAKRKKEGRAITLGEASKLVSSGVHA